MTITLSEAKALYETLDETTGGNADNVFAWDGSDSPSDPGLSAWAKVFIAAGRPVPEEMRDAGAT